MPTVLQLQRSAGNAAVVAALRVQRQEQTGETETGSSVAEVPQLDPELARQLRELFPDPVAGTYEVIGGSTGAQSTSGQLTEGALETWRRERIDLDEAYRRSADRSHLRGGRAVYPTRGGGESSGHGVRWGLLLAAWDYQNRQGRPTSEVGIPPNPGVAAPRRETNLYGIQAMLRQGSPYRVAAEASYEHHRIVENPTAIQMDGAIVEEIYALAIAGGGQLTVNFQGHGGRGRIVGVNGGVLDRNRFRRLGEMASRQGVHLTFVLDTCNVGSAALLAENSEMFEVGQDADDLPAEVQAEMQRIGRPLCRLTRLGLRLNDLAMDLRWAKVRTTRERQETVETLVAVRAKLKKISEFCQNHPEMIGAAELPLLAITPDLEFRLLLDDDSFTRRQARDARELLAPLLDRLNEVIGTGVDRLRALTEARDRRPARGPG